MLTVVFYRPARTWWQRLRRRPAPLCVALGYRVAGVHFVVTFDGGVSQTQQRNEWAVRNPMSAEFILPGVDVNLTIHLRDSRTAPHVLATALARWLVFKGRVDEKQPPIAATVAELFGMMCMAQGVARMTP